MQRAYASIALIALSIAFGCSDDSGDTTSTTTGGQTSTGGTAASGMSGTATGGSSGSASGGAAGSGAMAGGGSGGAQGGTTSAGQGGTGTGEGGAGECAPSSSDGECARCMLEHCCEAWHACAADEDCNACGSCLDDTSNFGACILMQPPLCNFVGDDATSGMIQCGCEPDANAQCVGPCASACGFD